MLARSTPQTPTEDAPVAESGALAPRWRRVRMASGYGATGSMALYLLVKCIWVATALSSGTGPGEWHTTDWIVLNTVTVAMAATGAALGLALAQDWGRRLPATLVLIPAWVGAGFLVPLLPYMLLSPLVTTATNDGADSGGGSGEALMPSWEVAFITVGFIGMAIGIAIALPIYLRERWPAAVTGTVADATRNRAPAEAQGSTSLSVVASGSAAAVGILWLTWAAGGAVGLDPAQRHEMTSQARLLMASAGLWAVAGAWATWTLSGTRRVPRMRLWVPMATAFASSGSLFAWSCWKLPLAVLKPSGYATVEYPAVAVLEHGVSIAAGLAMLATLLHLYRLTNTVKEI